MISGLWRWMRGKPAASAIGAPEASEGPAASGEAPARLGTIELHPEPGRERWTRRALRTVIIAAGVLLLLVGLRALVRPYPKPEPVVLPASLAYERGAAQAVATRWVQAYLTLTEGDAGADSRAALLAQDTASNVDTSGGLDVTAPQDVQVALPGSVQVSPDGRSSIVTVLARVKSGTTAARWVALAVPVGTDGRRPVVTGTGAFVALPPPGPAEQQTGSRPEQDSTLTAATRDRAAAWFTAYGADNLDALTGISAPGSQVAPIGGLTLKSVDTWQVDAGGPDTRAAVATVTWQSPSGQFKQTYQLTLSAVRAGSTTDWRVLTVTAATQR